MFHGCLAGRPYPRDTRETQLSPSILTLRIPVMCKAHASLCWMLSCELPMKTSSVFNSLSFHTLSVSITQPLRLNPTINTGYKRLNKVTIKFGTELNPTKHIVVNYNFTFFIHIWTARAIHMLRGLNVDAHFWQKGLMVEEAQQYDKDGERKQ